MATSIKLSYCGALVGNGKVSVHACLGLKGSFTVGIYELHNFNFLNMEKAI